MFFFAGLLLMGQPVGQAMLSAIFYVPMCVLVETCLFRRRPQDPPPPANPPAPKDDSKN